MSSNIATAFRPRSAYVTAARRSNRAATAVAVFRSIHNQLSIASTSVAEPCAPLRLRNIIESSFSSAQLAASTVKIGNRAPAVRAVEVRAVASNTAQVKNRIDLMSENSPKRADCKEARMANEQGRRGLEDSAWHHPQGPQSTCRSRMRSTPPSKVRCFEPKASVSSLRASSARRDAFDAEWIASFAAEKEAAVDSY
eukprot:scaffold110439_cov32-Tisochrysis_lutea.AAC.2